MLHIHSYNMGLAAGITAREAGLTRPDRLDKITGMLAILYASGTLRTFFPSSYIEGYVTAYDVPRCQFSEWDNIR